VDEIFAEIEYEHNPQNAAPAASQPVAQRKRDPIREKFYDMRSLATYNPFARDDAALFYKQATLMADFEDDFPNPAAFSDYFPCYQRMGYEQLRSYFTWRTKTRRGETEPCDTSYTFLYIYELLNGIGGGLDELINVWTDPALDKYMPGWLKDYHIYYGIPGFADFVSRHKLHAYYPEMFLWESENRLELWNSMANYDITKSKFYQDGYQEQMRDCFQAVAVTDRLTSGSSQLIYTSKGAVWQPFRRAMFFDWKEQQDRTAHLPGGEVYHCKNGRWTADLPIWYSGRKEFFGYVIKKTEACLRQALGYKYKLNVKQNKLDAAIEAAVAEYHLSTTRTVVSVDHDNLARIREEALGTQDKLLVEEVEEIEEETIETLEESGWDALTPTETAALRAPDFTAFALANNLMPEILADSINEKAADYLGDSLLDEDFIIYDEYKEMVEQICLRQE